MVSTDARRLRGRTAIAAAGIAVLLTLAGCAPEADDVPAPQASSPNATPDATASPQSEPSRSDDPADPGTWVVTDRGIGPVDVGEDYETVLEEVRGAGIGPLGPQCEGVAYAASEDNTYDVQIVDDRDASSDGVVEVSAHWNGDVMGVGPRTPEGLGLGSTKAEVRSVYEDATERASQIDGRSFVVRGEGEARIVFEYVDGNEGAVGVAVIARAASEPAYEPCA
ncbi:hypothetical protein [Microbacterium sp. gxy059]|uniref:hypothetical protein n=1 Tax=Microbacterium sp. gxy059 TaxID=2957199 RepID=UPI003D993CBF